jgi:hypothetical protein
MVSRNPPVGFQEKNDRLMPFFQPAANRIAFNWDRRQLFSAMGNVADVANFFMILASTIPYLPIRQS